MILTGSEIIKNIKSKRITIIPFNEHNITTNSYDFHIGEYLIVYKNKLLDAKKNNPTKKIKIPKEGIILLPEKLYLGSTREKIGSNYFVPVIRGRSSTGRLGIFIHITADLIDIGSINQYTLMIHVVQPVKIYPNMKIGQVTFWKPKGKIDLYKGKYNNLSGPQKSQMYKDFIA